LYLKEQAARIWKYLETSYTGGTTISGGGPQRLSSGSMITFCLHVAKVIHYSHSRSVRILWAGIGSAEEAILLTKFLLTKNINVMIDGIDVDESSCQRANQKINKFECGNNIKIIKENYFNFTVAGKYDICWTSAAINDIFIYKLIFDSIQSEVTWCFLSSNNLACLRKLKLSKLQARLFCKATLDRSSEKRNVRVLTLNNWERETTEMLQQEGRSALRNEFSRHLDRIKQRFYDIWRRRKDIHDDMDLTIHDIISGDENSHLTKYQWLPFHYDHNESRQSHSNLVDRVCDLQLMSKINSHFMSQFLDVFKIPERCFRDCIGEILPFYRELIPSPSSSPEVVIE